MAYNKNPYNHDNRYEKKSGLSGRARIVIALVILSLLAVGLIVYDRAADFIDGMIAERDTYEQETIPLEETVPDDGENTIGIEIADTEKDTFGLTQGQYDDLLASLLSSGVVKSEEEFRELMEGIDNELLTELTTSTTVSTVPETETAQEQTRTPRNPRQTISPTDTKKPIGPRSLRVEHFFADGGRKIGFKNYDTGETIIEPIYDGRVQFYTNEPQTYLAVEKDKKFGVIDLDNNVVVPFEYDRIDYKGDNAYWRVWKYSDNRIPTYGLLRRSDVKLILPVEYEDIESIEKGFIAVKKNGLWGAVNESNKEIVPIKYHGGLGTSRSSDGNYIYLHDDNGNTLQFNNKGKIISRH